MIFRNKSFTLRAADNLSKSFNLHFLIGTRITWKMKNFGNFWRLFGVLTILLSIFSGLAESRPSFFGSQPKDLQESDEDTTLLDKNENQYSCFPWIFNPG